MKFDRRLFWTLAAVLLFGFVLLLLLACEPTSNPITTSTSTSTIVTTTTLLGTPAGNTEELQEDLNDGVLVVDKPVTSNGTLRPPEGASIVFGENGILVRTEEETGAAIDISNNDVTITNLRVRGSNPCYWTNTIAYNPNSIGETYSQWSAEKDSSGVRYEEHAALYIRGGAENITVNGLEAYDVWGDGVTIFGGKDINISNLHAKCVGRSALSNVEGENVTVDGGSVSGAFWWGVNIEPFGSKVVRNMAVKNFTFGYSRVEWLFVSGPNFNCEVYNVDIYDVTLLPTSTRPSKVNGCVASEVVKPVNDLKGS